MAEEKEAFAKIIKSEYALLFILIIGSVFFVSLMAKQKALYAQISEEAGEANINESQSILIRDAATEAANESNFTIKSLTPSSFSGQKQVLAIETNRDSECLYSSNSIYSEPKSFAGKTKENEAYLHSSEMGLPEGSYIFYVMCFSADKSSEKAVQFAVYNGEIPQSPGPAKGSEAVSGKSSFSFYLGFVVIALLALDLLLLTAGMYKKMLKGRQMPDDGKKSKSLNPAYKPTILQAPAYRRRIRAPLRNPGLKPGRKTAMPGFRKQEGEYLDFPEFENRLKQANLPRRGEIWERLKKIAGRKYGKKRRYE